VRLLNSDSDSDSAESGQTAGLAKGLGWPG
jgi:hypothetical protein